MKKTLVLVALAAFAQLTQAQAADRQFEKDLAIGYVDFKTSCSVKEVTAIAEKFVKDDTNFSSVAVFEGDKDSYGIFFRYHLNKKIKTEDDLSAYFKKSRESNAKNCKDGDDNVSSSVILIN